MGIFVKFWPFFTMPAHQIWSCYVTQEANFENFSFCPNSTFNIRKSRKISSGKALYFRSYQPKSSRGVESTPPPPPVSLGLKHFCKRTWIYVYLTFMTDQQDLARHLRIEIYAHRLPDKETVQSISNKPKNVIAYLLLPIL